MIENAISFRKRDLEPPTRFKGRRSESLTAQKKAKSKVKVICKILIAAKESSDSWATNTEKCQDI